MKWTSQKIKELCHVPFCNFCESSRDQYFRKKSEQRIGQWWWKDNDFVTLLELNVYMYKFVSMDVISFPSLLTTLSQERIYVANECLTYAKNISLPDLRLKISGHIILLIKNSLLLKNNHIFVLDNFHEWLYEIWALVGTFSLFK